MLKNSLGARVLKRGAMSTLARPAKSDERAQAKADTRSAAMPFSSVIRGLSTTARIWVPSAEKRNRAASEAIRSEEHTSELQSLMRISYAVFCLKKKKEKKNKDQ